MQARSRLSVMNILSVNKCNKYLKWQLNDGAKLKAQIVLCLYVKKLVWQLLKQKAPVR